MTEFKSKLIQQTFGCEPTGYVLCDPKTGRRCIVEMGAVRWLETEEMWILMHTESEIEPPH